MGTLNCFILNSHTMKLSRSSLLISQLLLLSHAKNLNKTQRNKNNGICTLGSINFDSTATDFEKSEAFSFLKSCNYDFIHHFLLRNDSEDNNAVLDKLGLLTWRDWENYREGNVENARNFVPEETKDNLEQCVKGCRRKD